MHSQRTRMNFPKVNNVKAHWKVCNDTPLILPTELQDKVIHHTNFFTLRRNGYVYTIFLKNGHVNVSGIRNFNAIKDAMDTFNDQFVTNIHNDNIIVDNTTASGRLPQEEICLHQFARSHQHLKELTISIRPHYFPSAVIRQKKKKGEKKEERRNKKGTIVLFANGKYNILGCQTKESIEDTFNQLCVLTQTLSMT